MGFGYGVVEALYQTVTTVATVGYREVRPIDTAAEQLFTIAVILLGVGTALYTFTVGLESLIEGEVAQLLGRRRMDRSIAQLSGHLIICGFGRVGREVARDAHEHRADAVVIDLDGDRLGQVRTCPVIQGDATDEGILRAAGIDRARALISALHTDADNLYVTLTARGMNPDLFIISRARLEASEGKMRQAGADRVVNPQRLGGARMAAFALQPSVTEFLDVIMHERSLDYRLEEIPVPQASPLAGRSIREAHIRDRTGALVLALRTSSGRIDANPAPETVIEPDAILIVVGTTEQLKALDELAEP